MHRQILAGGFFAFLLAAASGGAQAQVPSDKGANAAADDSEVRPPVTKADVKIAQRAREILNSPAKWNRADTRICPAEAKTFSLYCALEKATNEVTGDFKHRGAAMQETRFVVDEVAPNRKNYHHRLMDYNKDPTTSFADIQNVLKLVEERVTKRWAEQSKDNQK